jgi:t-SNARE complex subunit (syntaxin)
MTKSINNLKINFIPIQEIKNDNFDECVLEYENEVETLCDDIKDITEIYATINNIVKSQNENINIINISTENTLAQVKEANINLEKAESYQKKFTLFSLLTIGLVTVNIPIILLFGLKIGTLTSLTSVGIKLVY